MEVLAIIGRWLWTHPAAIAATLLTLALAMQTWRLDHAHSALETARADTAIARAAVSGQNAQIGAWKEIGDAKAKLADTAIQLAAQAGQAHEARATDIMRVPVPTPDKECAATLDLLRQFQ